MANFREAPTDLALEPGQSGDALTRLYFVKATMEEWYARMRRELLAQTRAAVELPW